MQLINESNIDTQVFLNIKDLFDTNSESLPVVTINSENETLPVIICSDSYEQDSIDFDQNRTFKVTVETHIYHNSNSEVYNMIKELSQILIDNQSELDSNNMTLDEMNTTNTENYARESEKFSVRTLTTTFTVQ